MQTVEYFDYSMVEPTAGRLRRGALRRARHRLLDRRAAREGEGTSSATRWRRAAVLPLSGVQGAARPMGAGAAPRRQVRRPAALAAGELQRGGRLGQADCGCRTRRRSPPRTQADLDAIRIDQLEMLQVVDEAIGGSTAYGITGIMQHLRDLGIADNTFVVYFSDNGWQWGEHRMQRQEQALRGVDPLADVRPLTRNWRRCRAPRASFALNIDLARPSPSWRCAAPTRRPASASTAPAWCACSTARAPTWRTDFLTEGWPGSHVWATVREARLEVHASCR